ncbi:MAG: VWA domain-containing protein [Candidatus Aminicenantes bacterium]|jgi:VWFA-related protein
MKKTALLTVVLFLSLGLSAQQEQHEVTVTNIMVPVRVFDGKTFIADLKIDDFEIYENGVLQKTEALYLANKDHISREEEYKEFAPATNRTFFLIFQLTDYHPKLEGVIDHFFQNIIVPGDTLSIQTPLKNYSLSPQALKTKSKEVIADELKKILRKDITTGSSEYKSLTRDLSRLVRTIQTSAGVSDLANTTAAESGDSRFGIELLLPRYRDSLSKLDDLRVADEKRFLGFAGQLKDREGQKNVLFFYQREFRPEIAPNVLNQMQSMYHDNFEVQGAIQELYMFYNRDQTMNVDRLSQAFSDSGMTFHFLFLNKEPEYISGVRMNEQSEDVFEALSSAAYATGGTVDNSHEPDIAFKNAMNATESYYILYYSPKNYTADGTFKNIEVKLKNKDYKITYRSGYFAR